MLEIRRYEPGDQGAVWKLHVLGLQQVGAYAGDGPWDDDVRHIESAYLNNHGEFLVGRWEGRIVAMGALRRTDERRAEIKRMRVQSDFQGRGFGQSILMALEARARELGYTTLHLDTSTIQVAAQKLYLKNGYQEIERRMHLGMLCIFYEKELPSAPSLVQHIERIVEEACKAESNIFGYGIWSYHIVYVVKYGRQLAQMLGADAEIVELAALLHDYAGIKSSAFVKDHHIHGPIEAEKLLSDLGYPGGKIEAVKACIASHRGSIEMERTTPEAICLASADAMAHIEQVPSLLYLTFARWQMSIDEGSRWVREKLERSWRKLCPEGRLLMQEKYEAALKMLARAEEG